MVFFFFFFFFFYNPPPFFSGNETQTRNAADKAYCHPDHYQFSSHAHLYPTHTKGCAGEGCLQGDRSSTSFGSREGESREGSCAYRNATDTDTAYCTEDHCCAWCDAGCCERGGEGSRDGAYCKGSSRSSSSGVVGHIEQCGACGSGDTPQAKEQPFCLCSKAARPCANPQRRGSTAAEPTCSARSRKGKGAGKGKREGMKIGRDLIPKKKKREKKPVLSADFFFCNVICQKANNHCC